LFLVYVLYNYNGLSGAEYNFLYFVLLYRYQVELVPGHEYKRKMSVVIKAENGILLKVLPRKKV
jgi:hypothetical protein